MVKHTPPPYLVEAGQEVFHIVRRWEPGVVDSGKERTFGSGAGAHVAQVMFVGGAGMATREKAKANADFLVLAANSFDALAGAAEAWEKWLLARALGRGEEELIAAAVAQKKASNILAAARGEG